MSDQHEAGPLPELTPEQESDVRRLLAEARHTEPIPTAVADRLDTVLGGLTRDEPGSPGVAPVIDLAARRRRRNAAGLLAGAAAVIVAGFVGGQLIDVGSDDDAGTVSTEAGADRAGPADDEAHTDAKAPSALASSGDTPGPVPASPQTVFKLSSRHLARDVRDQLDGLPAAAESVRGPAYLASGAAGCTPAAPSSKYGTGDFFPALFDGTPAVLALRPPADGVQVADVLACDTAAFLASTDIPSP